MFSAKVTLKGQPKNVVYEVSSKSLEEILSLLRLQIPSPEIDTLKPGSKKLIQDTYSVLITEEKEVLELIELPDSGLENLEETLTEPEKTTTKKKHDV